MMGKTSKQAPASSSVGPVSQNAPWVLGCALIGALILGLSACRPVDTSIDQADATSEILAATDYKAKECGQRPPFVLIPPDNVEEHALRLCSILITRATCPFHEYPPFCSEMYGHIPGAPQ